MKLKNKKTGEIVDYSPTLERWNGPSKEIKHYVSLAELNEEWEDYKEPSKTIWQIKDSGELQDFEEDDFSDGYMESSKSIGNYFETKEEAEKAVEKLKAWKRLKDKGFKVDLWDYDGSDGQGRIRTGRILFRVKDYEENDKDLDLLFSQEDD